MPAPPTPGEPLFEMLLGVPPSTPIWALTIAWDPLAEMSTPSGSLPMTGTPEVPLLVIVFPWKLLTLMVPPPTMLLASNQTPLPRLLLTVLPTNDVTLIVPPSASTCTPVVGAMLALATLSSKTRLIVPGAVVNWKPVPLAVAVLLVKAALIVWLASLVPVKKPLPALPVDVLPETVRSSVDGLFEGLELITSKPFCETPALPVAVLLTIWPLPLLAKSPSVLFAGVPVAFSSCTAFK